MSKFIRTTLMALLLVGLATASSSLLAQNFTCGPASVLTGEGTVRNCSGAMQFVVLLKNGDANFSLVGQTADVSICTSPTDPFGNPTLALSPTHPHFQRIVSGAQGAKLAGKPFAFTIKQGSGGLCEIVHAYHID